MEKKKERKKSPTIFPPANESFATWYSPMNLDCEHFSNTYFTLLPELSFKNTELGFPGGAVVENPPANAGDPGLIPDPGGSHMPWSK